MPKETILKGHRRYARRQNVNFKYSKQIILFINNTLFTTLQLSNSIFETTIHFIFNMLENYIIGIKYNKRS